MSRLKLTRRAVLASGAFAGLAGFDRDRADLVPFIYLLPAPKEAIALAPFTLAERLGFYQEAGLDVRFELRRGGLEVGKALARGEGDLGGASGDTPVLLRDQGFTVKGTALLGRHAFLTVMTRRDRNVLLNDLSGRTLGVPSLTDVSNYGLEHVIAASGAKAVTVRAAPSAELWAGLASGEFDGIVGTVDWGVRAERSGVALDYLPLDTVFPGAMAQATLASETAIQTIPDRIRAFNQATVQAIRTMLDQPEAAARQYELATPTSDLSAAEITRVFMLFGAEVYGRAPNLGAFDPARIEAIAADYRRRGLITTDVPAAEVFLSGLSA